jgi:hypothetical protein
MLAEGYSPKAVAEILGHASDAVSTQIYRHLLPGMDESAGATDAALIAVALGGVALFGFAFFHYGLDANPGTG